MKAACQVALDKVRAELGIYLARDEDNNICVQRTRDGMGVTPEEYALGRFKNWAATYSSTEHIPFTPGMDLGRLARKLIERGWSRTSVADALYMLIKE